MITIELRGPQGSGKTTMMDAILTQLVADGYELVSQDEDAHTAWLTPPPKPHTPANS